MIMIVGNAKNGTGQTRDRGRERGKKSHFYKEEGRKQLPPPPPSLLKLLAG